MSKCFLVAGLAWGDEAKGACVDFLTREHNATLIIRYNGGSQAAHNVVTENGKHHTFAQFGSGSLIPEVSTHLSRFVLVNPLSMVNEERHLESIGVKHVFSRTSIENKALIITPFHRALNRLRESVNAYGSCGVGIGETRKYHLDYGEDALFAEDLASKSLTRVKLELIQYRMQDEAKKLNILTTEFDAYSFDKLVNQYYDWQKKVFVCDRRFIEFSSHHSIIFEGAQGVLLDERDEFAPHNTWTDTTFRNAETLLDEAGYDGEAVRVGCIRSYMTRHGAGPFPTEHGDLQRLSELHNSDACFQGKFRRGHFDMKSVNHALDIVGGVDEIHMSHVDQLKEIYPGIDEEKHVANIERLLETPITVTGHGSRAVDRRKRESKVINARRRSAQVCTGVALSTPQQAE